MHRPAIRIAADPNDAPELIRASVSVATAAGRLDCDNSTIRKLLASGELEGHRLGKRALRVYVDSIEAYQRRRPTVGKGPAEPPAPPRKARKAAAHREAVAYLAGLNLLSRA